MEDEFKQTKNLFKSLTKNENSVFYSAEKITNNLLKKANKSNYSKDKFLSKLHSNSKALINDINNKDIVPIYTSFIEQKILIVLLYLVFDLLLIYCMLMLWILNF